MQFAWNRCAPTVVGIVFSLSLHATLVWIGSLPNISIFARVPSDQGGANIQVRLTSNGPPKLARNIQFNMLLGGPNADIHDWLPSSFSAASQFSNSPWHTRPFKKAPDDWSRFLPSELLDRESLPLSGPDIARLADSHPSGMSVRIRIYIDETGVVRSVQVLEAGLLDTLFVDQVQAMLLQTGFIPGRLDGRDVASFKDVELSFENVPDLPPGPVSGD